MTSLKVTNFGLILFTVAVFAIFSPVTLVAARLYFVPESLQMHPGKEARVDLVLDPEGKSVNALEMILMFPSSLLAYRSALTGESIVSMWIEKPNVSAGEISFAGIMPGGFSGVIEAGTEQLLPGPIASFIFLPTQEGSGRLQISKAKLILNDGKGTELHPVLTVASIAVFGVASSTTEIYDSGDTLPPEDFNPVLIRSKSVHGGKYSLVFNASDKGSGVDHYEVKEGDGDFHRAESPYPLADQTLSSIIYVRAIDVAGNERTVLVSNDHKGPVSFGLGSSDLLFALGAVFLVIILWYTKGKHHP